MWEKQRPARVGCFVIAVNMLVEQLFLLLLLLLLLLWLLWLSLFDVFIGAHFSKLGFVQWL